MATRKRFTKALFLRICAVGLFLCLGTFAVMHSIQNQNSQKVAGGEDDGSETDDNKQQTAEALPVSDAGSGGVEQVSGVYDGQAKQASSTTSLPSNGSEISKFRPNSTRPAGTTSGTTPPPRFNGSSSSSLPPSRPGRFNGSTNADDATKKPSRSLVPPLSPKRNTTPVMQADSTAKPPAGYPVRPNTDPMQRFGANRNSEKSQPATESDSEFLKRSSLALAPGQLASNRRLTQPPKTDPTSSADRMANSSTGSAAGMLPGFRGGPPSQPSTSPSTERTFPQLPSSRNSNDRTDTLAGRTRTSPSQPESSSRLPDNRSTGMGQRRPMVNPNMNREPIVPKNPSQSLIPENSIPGRRVADSNPSNRSMGGTAERMQDTRSNMASGTLRSMPAASSNPSTIRNVSASMQQDVRNGSGRPRTTLASAPISSATTSAVAQPTPGAREFQGVQLPALAVQKMMPREIQVNREATFELIVKNTGKATANGVQVHDFVPQGTRFIEATPAATPTADGRIRWDLGSMQPGQQTSIKMKVLPQRAGNIGSVAHVTFGAQATAQTVCTKPELEIRAEAPETVLIGQDVVMNIFVENKGNGAAENVVIQEDVPDGLIFNGGQRELEFEIGTLRPGQTRNVKLRLKAAKVGQVRNILAAHGAGDLMANDSVDVRIVAPKLAVEGSGPSRKFLNREATHTFNVANQGTAPATNMQLVAQLPRGLRFVSAPNGQYDARNHAVVWRLARLDEMKSQSVEVTTTPVAVGQHQINFTATADLNLREQTQQSLSVQQLSELFFDIDDSADAIEVGSGTTFRVKVVNQGQIPATNVRVKVEFPPALQPRSVQGVSGNPIQGQMVVLDTIPSMQPGQELSFVIAASAVQAGEHRTVVSVSSDDRKIAVSKEESTHVYSDR